MRQGGQKLAIILKKLGSLVKPGLSAETLELAAHQEITKTGAKAAFLNYQTGFLGKYPAALCVSVNEEVVHGLPAKNKIFQKGDLVGLDCGIWYGGLCVDAAITVGCGEISPEAQKLINVTREALRIGISRCRLGNCIGDIGEAIQKYVEAQNFSVIRSLVGHGVGRQVHEDPSVPNFFPIDETRPKNRGAKIKDGMTLAIEPMVAAGSARVKRGRDGYAAATQDKSWSAHFEHTVAVTKTGTLILTQ